MELVVERDLDVGLQRVFDVQRRTIGADVTRRTTDGGGIADLRTGLGVSFESISSTFRRYPKASRSCDICIFQCRRDYIFIPSY